MVVYPGSIISIIFLIFSVKSRYSRNFANFKVRNTQNRWDAYIKEVLVKDIACCNTKQNIKFVEKSLVNYLESK